VKEAMEVASLLQDQFFAGSTVCEKAGFISITDNVLPPKLKESLFGPIPYFLHCIQNPAAILGACAGTRLVTFLSEKCEQMAI
jgi:hypothetical protein